MNVSLEIPQSRRYRVVLNYALRGVYATVLVIINYLIFFLVPSFVFSYFSSLTASVKANITAYFVMIEVLTVMRIMLKDHLLGAVSGVGLNLVQAVYIYTITLGGALALSFNGFSITIEFKTLVYLMMAIPLLGMVKQVYEMVYRSSAKPITMIEVAG